MSDVNPIDRYTAMAEMTPTRSEPMETPSPQAPVDLDMTPPEAPDASEEDIVEEETEDTEEAATEAPSPLPADEADEEDEEESTEEEPKESDKERKLRDEAKKYRLRLREAEKRIAALEREGLIAKHGRGIPAELRQLITGTTAEEIKTSAALLRKHLGAKTSDAERLPGGKQPDQPPAQGFANTAEMLRMIRR